jgi:hypothetical protein
MTRELRSTRFLVLTISLALAPPVRAAAQSPLEVETDAGQTLFQVDGTGGLLAPLPPDIPAIAIPIEGPGTRFMWHPTQAALRAGLATDAEWNATNVGFGSVALGRGTTASGDYTFAVGDRAAAAGRYSFATGLETTASGTKAVAMGESTTASGAAALAIGIFATASGDQAMAGGFGVEASGTSSVAFGRFLEASGETSTALGIGARARADHSAAIGDGVEAEAFASMAIGRFNVPGGTPENPVGTDPLFVAGNGETDNARSNALTLLQNGDLTIAGTLTESSDIRLKTDVESMEGALDGVLRLTPIRFRYRPGTGHPAGLQIGLSAQEVRTVFPEVVSEDLEGYLSVAYTDLAAVLVGAVKDQQSEIEHLRVENAALRERDTAMARELAVVRSQVATLKALVDELRGRQP